MSNKIYTSEDVWRSRNAYTVEQLDGKWYVLRGDMRVSPGYTYEEVAYRELAYKKKEEFRVLHTVEGGYCPQFRWSPEWSWFHFKHRVKNEYQSCKTFEEAQRWMTDQGIVAYEVVEEVRS